MCWACSIGSVQSNKTWSDGNPQAVWCFGYAVLVLSSPTRPGLLEMLRQCGACVGHAVLALSTPTSPGLLEILRQCGVLDV